MVSERRHYLRLVGKADAEAIRIEVAPRSRQPFPVEALILEEDTWFALSAPAEVKEPDIHPVRVMTEAWEAEPAAPGSVHVRAGCPLRILAVVHDLSLEPSWRMEWVEVALRRALTEARQRGLSALGIEPLGAVHGRFPEPDFDELLARVVRSQAEPPRAIWRIHPEIVRRRI